MQHLMNVVLMLPLLSLACCYHRDGTYTVAGHSKSHIPRVSQARERIQARNFNSEINDKTQYDNNEDMRQNPVRRPQSVPSGRDNYSQYSSEDNGGNYQKLLHEKRTGPPSELREASADSSDSIKYMHNKGNDNYDRSYQDNYSERQSQPAYNDNTSRAKYNGQLVNHEAENKQLSQPVYAERSREGEDRRNVRYESREISGQSREHPQYHESEEVLNRRPIRYSDKSAEYQPEKPHDNKRYMQPNNENYRAHSSDPDNTRNRPANNQQNHPHNRHHYDIQNGHDVSTSKDSSQYSHHPQDNAPPHSNYRDPRTSEQPYAPGDGEARPNHHRDNAPNQFIYRESNHPEQQPALNDRQPHHKQHREHENQRYEQHNQDHRSPRQQPNAYGQPSAGEHVQMDAQDRQPLPQQPRNSMKVVETKRDMQSAPSEADSHFSEEHDGFLDMGAYTDKQGSFGWYADFPVGKEHDKVTYSFSK